MNDMHDIRQRLNAMNAFDTARFALNVAEIALSAVVDDDSRASARQALAAARTSLAGRAALPDGLASEVWRLADRAFDTGQSGALALDAVHDALRAVGTAVGGPRQGLAHDVRAHASNAAGTALTVYPQGREMVRELANLCALPAGYSVEPDAMDGARVESYAARGPQGVWIGNTSTYRLAKILCREHAKTLDTDPR